MNNEFAPSDYHEEESKPVTVILPAIETTDQQSQDWLTDPPERKVWNTFYLDALENTPWGRSTIKAALDRQRGFGKKS